MSKRDEETQCVLARIKALEQNGDREAAKQVAREYIESLQALTAKATRH